MSDYTREFPDTGCEMAKAAGYSGPCLECPFEVCFEELGGHGITKSRTQRRDERIRQDRRTGMSIEELAVKYGRNKRTIARAINGR